MHTTRSGPAVAEGLSCSRAVLTPLSRSLTRPGRSFPGIRSGPTVGIISGRFRRAIRRPMTAPEVTPICARPPIGSTATLGAMGSSPRTRCRPACRRRSAGRSACPRRCSRRSGRSERGKGREGERERERTPSLRGRAAAVAISAHRDRIASGPADLRNDGQALSPSLSLFLSFPLPLFSSRLTPPSQSRPLPRRRPAARRALRTGATGRTAVGPGTASPAAPRWSA